LETLIEGFARAPARCLWSVRTGPFPPFTHAPYWYMNHGQVRVFRDGSLRGCCRSAGVSLGPRFLSDASSAGRRGGWTWT